MESLSLVDPLEDLRRVYRQACLALATGKTAEADRILNDVLPTQIAAAQRELGHDIAGDDLLQAVFADEQRRVRDAEAICELLLPRLQRALDNRAAPAPASRSFSPTERAEFASESRPAAAAFSAAPVGASSGPQSIADMLDSMLAQDGARSTRR